MGWLHRYHTFDDVPDDVLPWGEIIYRSCLMLVAVVLLFTAINFIYDISIDLPRLPLAPFALALVIYLVGRFFRAVLPG